MSFIVHDPRGTAIAAAPALARRPQTLAGLTIGYLDNGKEQADVILGRVAELFGREGGATVFARKPTFARVAPREVLEQLKACDIVITGLGG